jgi:CRP/FNR family cyclic AMP-dependent transcriptional regulator
MPTDTSKTPNQKETQILKTFKHDIAFLRLIPMFSVSSNEELARLCQIAAFRKFTAGEIILEEGVMNDTLFIIRDGFVELFHYGSHPEPFLRLGRTRFFGQVSMFDPAPASATVRAATDVELICLSGTVFSDLLLTHPALGTRLLLAVVQDFAKRHRQMIQELKEVGEHHQI